MNPRHNEKIYVIERSNPDRWDFRDYMWGYYEESAGWLTNVKSATIFYYDEAVRALPKPDPKNPNIVYTIRIYKTCKNWECLNMIQFEQTICDQCFNKGINS